MAGVLLSATIEALQLLPAISHICTLEDVMANAAGTAAALACGGAILAIEAIRALKDS